MTSDAARLKVKPSDSDRAVRLATLDLLATWVAVLGLDGCITYANSALEDALGVSRRHLVGGRLAEWIAHPKPLQTALDEAARNELSTLRFDSQLFWVGQGDLPVHLIVTPADHAELIVEIVPQDKQHQQDRETRWAEQAQANKELIRNLAHEIKNPLGGIRGSAQLLELEMNSPDLREYTRVIIHEADRLQALVDRLLAPHRRPHVVADLNIHEVLEHVRKLILAEFPRGLTVVQDYDASLPECRGDREQLIQAVLNIAHNGCQALAERIDAGDACIVFRTRVARQVTLLKQRHRLALELHVIDNGPGVPDAIKDRIFYPLVSGRDGGSGLGLTLAQTFIQQHQGLIACDSRPGCTDFKVLIPLP